MIPKKQTRLHSETVSGNCYAAAIASLLEMEVEDVIQIQEHYASDEWPTILDKWLRQKGYQIIPLSKQEAAMLVDEYYFVVGKSPRNSAINHICIYKNGSIIHDTHPDNTGIITEEYFSILKSIDTK